MSASRVDAEAYRLVARLFSATEPAELVEKSLLAPIRDFLSRPSHGFRARLAEAAWSIAGGVGPCPIAIPTAVELLHAGSLIVDDVQDASRTRRNRPALHRIHGVPLALNAGGTLYFACISALADSGFPAEISARLVAAASRLAVTCHGGQALDLSVRIDRCARHRVRAVVEATSAKAAALTELATRLPAIAAGAAAEVEDAVARFGSRFGIALQMRDDLGSLRAPDRRDKAAEDLGHARPTWPWAWTASGPCSDLRYAQIQRWCDAGEELEALAAALLEESEALGEVEIERTLSGARADLRDALERNAPEALVRLDRLMIYLARSYG